MTGSAGCNKAAEFIVDETDFPSNGQPKNFEETQNMIGYISGKNKRYEFIVIGACLNFQNVVISVVNCYIPHNNSLCLIDKEVLNYYRQLLNKQGGKQ